MINPMQKDNEDQDFSSTEKESLENNDERKDESEDWTYRISYKNPELLLSYMSELYRILPRRFNGLCAMRQRLLKREICRARQLAILPFVPMKKK